MANRVKSSKILVVSKKDASRKYWMEYVTTDGIIDSEGFVPEHYHNWEDQTFNVIEIP